MLRSALLVALQESRDQHQTPSSPARVQALAFLTIWIFHADRASEWTGPGHRWGGVTGEKPSTRHLPTPFVTSESQPLNVRLTCPLHFEGQTVKRKSGWNNWGDILWKTAGTLLYKPDKMGGAVVEVGIHGNVTPVSRHAHSRGWTGHLQSAEGRLLVCMLWEWKWGNVIAVPYCLFSIALQASTHPLKKIDICQTPVECWVNVSDVGPTSTRRWADISWPAHLAVVTSAGLQLRGSACIYGPVNAPVRQGESRITFNGLHLSSVVSPLVFASADPANLCPCK